MKVIVKLNALLVSAIHVHTLETVPPRLPFLSFFHFFLTRYLVFSLFALYGSIVFPIVKNLYLTICYWKLFDCRSSYLS